MFEKEGQAYGAYTLVKKEALEELNAVGYILRHNKTKARVVVVSNDDNNKVFNIGFRTPPKNDTGMPHIMEHSVLCGSREFPAKDPFVELVKGSLNTFLNAMTYPDKTLYPVASCNLKDFRNLMHVYLDGVFYPNIYEREQILKQEGWHYELLEAEAPLTYNGVVYNEMKGVYSSPEEQLMRLIQKSLLPDTPYECESGGDPEAITDLTQEEFLKFHQTYYHPSNSYIYLYGDMDFLEDLTFLDQHYLSNFEEKKIDSAISLCKPFSSTQRVTENYSIAETETLTNHTFFSYNAVIGTSLDAELYLAFQILDYVLLSSPGAPLKKALIDAGIGKDVYSSYDNGILQPNFSIIAKDANPEDEEKFIHLIHKELTHLANDGISERSLLAAMNYYEFKYKEANFGRFPKGLMYGLQMYDSWLYDDEKPFIHIKTNETFAQLKRKMKTGYFESLIQQYLIENTHKSIIVLNPEHGLNEKREEKVKEKLAAYKASLSKEEIQKLVEDTKALKQYQEEPTSKEDLLKIPLLSIEDIEKKAQPLINQEEEIEGVKVLHHNLFTNGIAYVNLAFRMNTISEADYPWAMLLACIYENIDTQNYSYKELSNEVNIQTGGIFMGVSILPHADGGSIPLMEIKTKVLFPKITEAFHLMEEMLFTTKFSDAKRLKEIIAEVKSKIQMQLSAQGHSVSANRAMSYFSQTAYEKDLTAGIGFYGFLKDLEENFEEKASDITKNLIRVSEEIYQKKNLIISYTADQEVKETLAAPVRELLNKLYPNGETEKEIEVYHPEIYNEGFKTASQVQYISTAGNFIKAGYSYTGALKVLQVMFSYDYLWNNIRVKGGAYGCMCGFSRFGDSYFTSYRDPNLMETYEIYKNAWEYVRSFDCDDRDMTKYIIGAISNMDVPLEAPAKGSRSFNSYLMGITEEDIQRERDELLSTRQETIRSLAKLIQSITDTDIICAIGGESKIEENKEHFNQIRSIF